MWISKVDDLIQYFINKNEVFSDHFFGDLPQKVLDNNNDPIKKLQDERGRDIEPGGGDDIDGWFFEIGKVNSFDIKDRFDITFGEFNFSIEQFRSVLDKIWTKISIDDGVTTWWQEEDLRDHWYN